MENKFLNIERTAYYLGVKKSTVYSWVHKRQIPFYKFGRLVKFQKDEIDKWTQERRVEVVDIDTLV